jgi:hypothetical protein
LDEATAQRSVVLSAEAVEQLAGFCHVDTMELVVLLGRTGCVRPLGTNGDASEQADADDH